MRLDQRLVALGLAPSRARAQALIAKGAVRLRGEAATRPAAQTGPEDAVTVCAAGPQWVGRGALKLLHALNAFGLDPGGARALDVGASTGGFTQVLLSRGAAHVVALDVGRGQLHPAIAADPRVTELSGVNARALDAAAVGPVDWIVADVSFISLTLALPAPLACARPGARLVALVKPQFEAGRAAVGKNGLVRDPADRAAAVARVCDWLEGRGWRVDHRAESPVPGGEGAVEHLIAALGPA
jgi:23S rRNA (cytidine1920-2'-O)/16S rRNA (cytidine1409-2'-O)-methyltransferase